MGTEVSLTAVRDAIRHRYGQLRAPGARYASLARQGWERAERVAAGDRGED